MRPTATFEATARPDNDPRLFDYPSTGGTRRIPPHAHEDVAEQLTAARARRRARLLAYAPPDLLDQVNEPPDA